MLSVGVIEGFPCIRGAYDCSLEIGTKYKILIELNKYIIKDTCHRIESIRSEKGSKVYEKVENIESLFVSGYPLLKGRSIGSVDLQLTKYCLFFNDRLG